MPKIAVIGAGWYAMIANLPSLNDYDGAELIAICDPDIERVEQAADEFGVSRRFTRIEDLIESGIADGVIVSVPHTAHYPVSRAALDAGLHVLVEKPMALHALDAWDMLHRAELQRRHLMVGQTFHFTSVAAAVRDSLPRIGELLHVVGTFASHTERLFRGAAAQADGRGGSYADPALVGGGQGHSQVSHLAGMVFWVTGLRALEVFAHMESRDLPVDLVDSISLRFEGGALGTLTATGTMPANHPPREEIVYYGTAGVIVQDLARAEARLLPADGPEELFTLAEGESRYPLGAPARAFADVIASRVDSTPGLALPAVYSVECLDAAYRSAALRRVISIAELDSTTGERHGFG